MAKFKFKAGVFYGNRADNAPYFPLTKAMIERRDKLAEALGYTKRAPCSFGPPDQNTMGAFVCYEHTALDYEHKGRKVSSYHLVHVGEGNHGCCAPGTELRWPEDVCAAAWAIDKGKPLPTDPKDGEAPAPEADPGQMAIPGT